MDDPLTPNPNRYVLMPIQHDDVWRAYKQAEACLWTAEELDLAADKRDWDRLTDGQRHFIETVLAFFAAADGIVNENLAQNFATEVQWPEARAFYGFQMFIEGIHQEVYGQLIQTLVADADRRAALFDGIRTVPSIRAKADWALKWTDRDHASFGERLVAFACVEGIAFSSSFCAIYYLKKQGLMCHGLGKSNELIARDEGLHRDFACMLFKKLRPEDQPSPETVHQIVVECVDAERRFVTEALPVALIGMSAKAMCEYVEFVADSLCAALGVPKVYGSPNPFEWMDLIALQGKTNFFEARVTEYAKAGVGGAAAGPADRVFRTDDDF